MKTRTRFQLTKYFLCVLGFLVFAPKAYQQYTFVGPGLTDIDATRPLGSEVMSLGDDAIRLDRRCLLEFGTNQHYLSGVHKSNFLSGVMFNSNSIPWWAFTSNSIPTWAITNATANLGKDVQYVSVTTTSLLTTTTAIPDDNTIPQISEGVEVVTTNIAPLASNNTLRVFALVHCGASAQALTVIAALFTNGVTNAVSAAREVSEGSNEHALPIVFEIVVLSTNSMTFSLRAGAESGTATINGDAGAAKLGGTLISGLYIRETKP